MAARIGIVLLVILIIGMELVAVPEARRIQHPAPGRVGTSGRVAGNGNSAGVRPSKWNTRRTLGGEKRTVPGGPNPQHHY